MIKFLDFIYENMNMNVQIAVDNIDNDFINSLISELSFIYKKRKERYIRPEKIVGQMDGGNINLRINMYNKDIILINYEENTLKLSINGDIVYHMDGITKNMIIQKVYEQYSKHLSKDNFKILKKSNPF